MLVMGHVSLDRMLVLSKNTTVQADTCIFIRINSERK